LRDLLDARGFVLDLAAPVFAPNRRLLGSMRIPGPSSQLTRAGLNARSAAWAAL